MYPKIDVARCNKCGRCTRVCPLLKQSSVVTKRLSSPKVFAAWNTDHAIRLDSTSGGVFSVLAQKMFDTGGYVGGAIYKEDHSVHHIVTNDPKKLDEIRSSKYLQSFINKLFNNIKELLEDEKRGAGKGGRGPSVAGKQWRQPVRNKHQLCR